MIKKILIANRGEIAIRIAKTCSKMGIKTVAIYSEEDNRSLHLEYCDEKYLLGKEPLKDSYLNKEKIVNLALETKVDAVHPGYGFLSENYEFANMLNKNNIIFIGPPVKAILAMGDKIESRKIAKKAGVNCIPGINQAVATSTEALKYAKKIGFPIMIKASAGGGGKGMRIANSSQDFDLLFRSSQNEAYNAFGDDRIFIEKYIEQPRHIEIQILGDKFGNVFSLGERECSIQRRHQKIIEESPSSFINNNIRKEMGQQAIKLAKSVGYYSAGTVEYVVNKKKEFFFLEMNTRLQVEHPVTETVLKIDLVEQMINIANDKKIPKGLGKIKKNIWSFESRLCAESPVKNFLPSAGRLTKFMFPKEGLRIDYGYKEGNNVSIYYDSMIAKVISQGKTRKGAIEAMIKALEEIDIRGIETNLNFLIDIYNNELFLKGKIDTNFIEDVYRDGYKGDVKNKNQILDISILAFVFKINYLLKVNKHMQSISKEWAVTIKENTTEVSILDIFENSLNLKINNKIYNLEFSMRLNYIKLKSFDKKQTIIGKVFDEQKYLLVYFKGTISKAIVLNKKTNIYFKKLPKKNYNTKKNILLSPMPGKVIEVLVKEGEIVSPGTSLIVLDAMKMENILKSEFKGKVKEVHINKGQAVAADQSLISFE